MNSGLVMRERQARLFGTGFLIWRILAEHIIAIINVWHIEQEDFQFNQSGRCSAH